MNEPCVVCGSYQTWIKPNGKEISRKINNQNACNNCYIKNWVKNNPEKRKLTLKKRITFKGIRFQLSKNPRRGICSECGKSVEKGEINVTQMHHTEYDESNPLLYTKELCPSCHRKEHCKIKKMVVN